LKIRTESSQTYPAWNRTSFTRISD